MPTFEKISGGILMKMLIIVFSMMSALASFAQDGFEIIQDNKLRSEGHLPSRAQEKKVMTQSEQDDFKSGKNAALTKICQIRKCPNSYTVELNYYRVGFNKVVNVCTKYGANSVLNANDFSCAGISEIKNELYTPEWKQLHPGKI